MARKSRRKVFDNETMTYSENEIVEENINKTAIYARLSREDNGIEFCTSIDNQIEYITKSLESFSDVNIVEVYSDNGFSGVNFSRNDWERMIEDIKSGKIN
ncbi:MAG: recombinase family protein, partial [Firmicutes bacterium]|nr:recombinase family protein [Bacillota bacterium]